MFVGRNKNINNPTVQPKIEQEQDDDIMFEKKEFSSQNYEKEEKEPLFGEDKLIAQTYNKYERSFKIRDLPRNLKKKEFDDFLKQTLKPEVFERCKTVYVEKPGEKPFAILNLFVLFSLFSFEKSLKLTKNLHQRFGYFHEKSSRTTQRQRY